MIEEIDIILSTYRYFQIDESDILECVFNKLKNSTSNHLSNYVDFLKKWVVEYSFNKSENFNDLLNIFEIRFDEIKKIVPNEIRSGLKPIYNHITGVDSLSDSDSESIPIVEFTSTDKKKKKF